MNSNNEAHLQAMSSAYPYVPGKGYVIKIRVLYSDYSDTDTSESLDLTTLASTRFTPAIDALPTNIWVDGAVIDVVELFDGGTISDVKAILGISGDDNGLVEEVDVGQGESTGRKTGAAPGAKLGQWFDTLTPLLQLDSTGGNLNTMTQGKLDVVLYFNFADEARTA